MSMSILWLFLSVAVPFFWLYPEAPSGTADLPKSDMDRAALHEASRWVMESPPVDREFDYVMTAKLRLLLFWVGKDDVGGGYIRWGERDTPRREESIQVLFGSDPEKAPRGINRWGAATEIVESESDGSPKSGAAPLSSAFFGFMKASEGDSVKEMENELSSEKTGGRHRFQASLTRVEPDRSVSVTIPFYSDKDFNLHELPEAETMVLNRLGEEREPQRHLEGAREACGSSTGFLFTVKDLIDSALSGTEGPVSRCYVHNAHLYTATLLGTEAVGEKDLDLSLAGGEKLHARYEHLLRARFEVMNRETGELTPFDLLVPTSGPLRGVPVEIVHQPKWWFKVVLTLKPAPAA